MKICKHDEKRQKHKDNLIKILRPKVYITHSSNFKNLVQQLTGNINETYSSPITSPPPPNPIYEVPPFAAEQTEYDHIHDALYDQVDLSSYFSSSPVSQNSYVMENALDHSYSNYKDIESMLMTEMESDSCEYDACFGMFQEEVCVYDHYGLSTLIWDWDIWDKLIMYWYIYNRCMRLLV